MTVFLLCAQRYTSKEVDLRGGESDRQTHGHTYTQTYRTEVSSMDSRGCDGLAAEGFVLFCARHYRVQGSRRQIEGLYHCSKTITVSLLGV